MAQTELDPTRAIARDGVGPVSSGPSVRAYRQLFDRESLASYLRLSTDTIDRLVKAGRLPCVRIGSQVRLRLRTSTLSSSAIASQALSRHEGTTHRRHCAANGRSDA
jgi:excisionase family DNA binding protein